MSSRSAYHSFFLLVAHLHLSARYALSFHIAATSLPTRHPTAPRKDGLRVSEQVDREVFPIVLDSLTSEELTFRFKDVLAYFASVPKDDPVVAQFTETYTPQLALLRGRLDNLHLDRCQILPSTKPSAGNGLFATRDIRQGELITLFPADAILFRDGEMEEVSGVLYGKGRAGDDFSLTDDAARSYEVRISTRHSIVGDPAMISDPAYLAHIANDAACLAEGDDVSRSMYSRQSVNGANGVFKDLHEGCHLGLFALRPITISEEIFVSYGEGYWLSRGSNEVYEKSKRSDDERRRLIAAQTKQKKTDQKKKDKKLNSSTSGNVFKSKVRSS